MCGFTIPRSRGRSVRCPSSLAEEPRRPRPTRARHRRSGSEHPWGETEGCATVPRGRSARTERCLGSGAHPRAYRPLICDQSADAGDHLHRPPADFRPCLYFGLRNAQDRDAAHPRRHAATDGHIRAPRTHAKRGCGRSETTSEPLRPGGAGHRLEEGPTGRAWTLCRDRPAHGGLASSATRRIKSARGEGAAKRKFVARLCSDSRPSRAQSRCTSPGVRLRADDLRLTAVPQTAQQRGKGAAAPAEHTRKAEAKNR